MRSMKNCMVSGSAHIGSGAGDPGLDGMHVHVVEPFRRTCISPGSWHPGRCRADPRSSCMRYVQTHCLAAAPAPELNVRTSMQARVIRITSCSLVSPLGADTTP